MTPPVASTRVCEAMSRGVPHAGPTTRVDQIVQVLLQRDLDGLPIVDGGGVIIGFASRTDLLRVLWLRGETEAEALLGAWLRVVLEDDALINSTERVHRTPLFEVLPPRVIKLAEGAGMLEAAELLTHARLWQVPVLTEDRRPVGVLSALDVLEWVRGEPAFGGMRTAPAARLPARGPLGIDPATPLGAVADVLVDWRVRAIPVIGPGRRYLGIVEDGELLRRGAGRPSSRAADVMREGGPTLPAGATLQDALELLLRERALQVPLLGPDGRVVNVVSALGLLEWCLARWPAPGDRRHAR